MWTIAMCVASVAKPHAAKAVATPLSHQAVLPEQFLSDSHVPS